MPPSMAGRAAWRNCGPVRQPLTVAINAHDASTRIKKPTLVRFGVPTGRLLSAILACRVLRHRSDDGLHWGAMGPGAPGFAHGHPIADTGKLSLAHATHPITGIEARFYAPCPTLISFPSRYRRHCCRGLSVVRRTYGTWTGHHQDGRQHLRDFVSGGASTPIRLSRRTSAYPARQIIRNAATARRTRNPALIAFTGILWVNLLPKRLPRIAVGMSTAARTNAR